MGRYIEKYWNEKPSSLEEGIAAIVTGGLTALMADEGDTWGCEIKDTVTGVVGSTHRAKTSKTKAHAEAWEDLLEKQSDYYNEQKAIRNTQRSTSHSYIATTTDSSDDNPLVKLLAYAIGGIIILWLILAVALPLAVINSCFILLTIGVANRKARKILYPLAFLAAIYLLVDYHKGGFTKLLSDNLPFLYKVVPFLYFSNIISGAIAAYLFIRDYIFRTYRAVTLKEELITQNIIVIASLVAAIIIVATQISRFSNTQQGSSLYSLQDLSANRLV